MVMRGLDRIGGDLGQDQQWPRLSNRHWGHSYPWAATTVRIKDRVRGDKIRRYRK